MASAFLGARWNGAAGARWLFAIIVMFRDGSPMARLVPNELLRTILTAFLSGTIGSSIACRG